MNSTFFKIAFLLLTLSVVFDGCKKKLEYETYNESPLYQYYPMKVGKYVEYVGDSIYFNDVTGSVVRDTVKFRLREEFEAIYSGPDSVLGDYRIFVKMQFLPDTNWVTQHTWYAQLDNSYLTKTEENLRFLKLNFPLALNKKWNGNVYLPEPDINDPNTANFDLFTFYDDWEYKITSINQPETINLLAFDSVMKVTEVYDSNLLKISNVYEKYAAGVGLVEKVFVNLETQNTSNPSLPFWQRAENGFMTKMKVVAYN